MLSILINTTESFVFFLQEKIQYVGSPSVINILKHGGDVSKWILCEKILNKTTRNRLLVAIRKTTYPYKDEAWLKGWYVILDCEL